MKPQYHDIIREPQGADTAVLLLHGILSAPQYFDFLLPAIPADYAVYGILLAGHGGDVSGLKNTTLRQWRAQTARLAKSLTKKYRRVIIAAHSMGTLFALRLAAKYRRQITGMLLLNTPLFPRLTPFGAVCSVMLALGFRPRTPRGLAMQRAYSIAPDKRLWQYLGWLPRYIELFREMALVRALLHRVSVPCTAFHAVRDELVAQRSLPPLYRMPSVRIAVLRDSSHFYYPPQDERRILRAWQRMLRRTQDIGGTPPLHIHQTKERTYHEVLSL